KQRHECQFRRCIVADKQGHYRCKRKAPFPLADDNFVEEGGRWGPKRLYGYMNNWVPGISINARCNNDGKLLTNGGDTKNISFYITSYAAKKQGKAYNLSAILAREHAYHLQHIRAEYLNNLQEQQHLLIFRLCHAVNREQELAAPLVVSYLMGWGDTYCSHKYTSIYWSSFVSHLLESVP
ncbi:hypothetical protein ARMSODRAFT_849374, partial [Armillaria solidipes]